MSSLKLFFLNPVVFFSTIYDRSKYILIINISFSILYLINEIYFCDLVDDSAVMFYFKNQTLAIFSSLLFEYLFVVCWALIIVALSRLFGIKSGLTSILLCFLSIKLISFIFIVLNIVSHTTLGENQFPNFIKSLQFIVEVIYIFIALSANFKSKILKTITIQLVSIVLIIGIISLMSLFVKKITGQHFFSTTTSVNLADGKSVSFNGKIRWSIVADKKLMSDYATDPEIAKSVIEDFFYASVYEVIVTEYAFKEVPDRLDSALIDEIKEKCNGYLSNDALGLKLINIELIKVKGR